MMTEILISLIGIVGTISTIIFAYLAFRRNGSNDIRQKAMDEGVLLSDVAHIKSSIDRIEEKLDKVEVNYKSLYERVVKLEQGYNILHQKIEIIEDSK